MSPLPPAVETLHREAGERPVHPRPDVDRGAPLTLPGRTVEGRLENVGAGGVCFVTGDTALIVAGGNFVRVAFDCERNGEPERLERAVRVLRAAREERDGAAVQVLGLQFEELLRLEGIRFPG